MSRSPLNQTSSIKVTIAISFVLLASNLYAQTHVPGIVGKNYIAMTVSNADSTSTWYENVFGLKLLKEINTADGSAHIRIEGNESLMVEILQLQESSNIIDCNLKKEQVHMLQGFFKVGLFVSDVEKAEQYLKSTVLSSGIHCFMIKKRPQALLSWRIQTGICYNLSRMKTAGKNELFFEQLST